MLSALLLTSCALLSTPTTTPTQQTNASTVEITSAAPTATPTSATMAPTATTAPGMYAATTQQVPAATPTSAPVAPAAPVATSQPVPFTSAPVVATSAPVQTSNDYTMDRVERRKLKQQRFAASIDSLVQSHNFRFLPNSMQELPGGWTQLIYNELYFVGIFKDHVEVHMPTVRGNVVQYIEILNFDTFEVKNYQVSRTQFGWSISFNMISGSDTNIAVSLMVYNLTGEAVLNLLTLSNTVRYVGYIQSLSKD